MISIIPVDIGKPTLKLEKATIRDGSCYWENPVQETVKFYQDPKTGKIIEKIYNFVVSTGSSKASFIGETSLDFAIYATSTKTSSVSLSLKNAKGDAVLHMSIQRLQENMDRREAKDTEKENSDYKERSLKAQLSITDTDGTVSSNSADDESINKVNPQVSEINVHRRASSVSELTLSSSGSSSELLIPRDFGGKSQLSLLHKTTSDVSNTSQEERTRSRWEWLGGPPHEISTDESISENCEEGSNTIIEKLKVELTALSRQAELSDLELQTLRKQIVKESKRGQDLLKEVVSLKEERDLFKEECENLKAAQKHIDMVKVKDKLKFEGGEWDPMALLEELRQELYYEKDLNVNLRIQLQKTQESNSELILAVRDLDELLEQKNKEKSVTSEQNGLKSESDDEEQKALDELVKEHTDIKDAHILETKIRDLCNELEICRRDKEDLEAQMEQISLDYEILNQENHDLVYKLEQSQIQEQLKMQYECSSPYTVINELENHVENLENQLKMQSNELSESMDKVVKLENQVKVLEEEIEKRIKEFEDDLDIITNAKVEEEKRAIQAEENLRKMRWQNGETAGRLQEEFKKLSVQMASTFEENEKLALKALTQADELRLQKSYLEDMLKKSKGEIHFVKDQYEEKMNELLHKLGLKDEKIEQIENEKKHGEEHLKKKLENLRSSMRDLETERTGMENAIELLRKEMEKSMEELKVLRRVKDEKESIVENLETKLEILKSENEEMKCLLSQDESEKQKLRKLVLQLKKREEVLSSLDKKVKDEIKINSRNINNNNKCAPPPRGTKEVANLMDKLKLLEGQIMLKELALENSTNKFLEKEKDLRHEVEGLETRLEELDHSTARIYECDGVKMVKGSEEVIGRNNELSKERSLDELCKEMELLQVRNKAMESELKEMQERYSEISLKFAEVEGERQQLVMTVRNLKNVKRS